MRNDSLCLVIALATHLGLDTDQLDIKSVFWNGKLVEEICVVPPPSIILDGTILRLDKVLYSLEQAPLAWFEKVFQALAEIGFISLPFDPYVFLNTDLKIIVVVYVDAITTAASLSDIDWLIDYVHSLFHSTGTGYLKYILGIEINYTSEGM